MFDFAKLLDEFIEENCTYEVGGFKLDLEELKSVIFNFRDSYPFYRLDLSIDSIYEGNLKKFMGDITKGSIL